MVAYQGWQCQACGKHIGYRGRTKGNGATVCSKKCSNLLFGGARQNVARKGSVKGPKR